MKLLAESQASEGNAVRLRDSGTTPLHNFRWIWAPGFVLSFGAFEPFCSFTRIETEFQHVLSLSVFIDAE